MEFGLSGVLHEAHLQHVGDQTYLKTDSFNAHELTKAIWTISIQQTRSTLTLTIHATGGNSTWKNRNRTQKSAGSARTSPIHTVRSSKVGIDMCFDAFIDQKYPDASCHSNQSALFGKSSLAPHSA